MTVGHGSVLLAEDDDDIRDTTALLLERAGWRVRTAANGALALQAALADPPDIAVVDVSMPVLDGIRLTRALTRAAIPVVLLTARDLPSDMVAGLDAGADDYVTKPFDGEVLSARLRAVLRRAAASAGPGEGVDRVGDLVVDRAAQTVHHGGRPVALSATEWRLLVLLVDFRGRVLTREQILSHVWPDFEDDAARVVDTNVQRLRRKLDPDLIVTVRGSGYRLDAS